MRNAAFVAVTMAALAVGCDDGPSDADPDVILADHSVTPALLKNLPTGVQTYALISSDDNLAVSPNFIFGGSADGAGLLKQPNGTFTLVLNHEDNFAVSRIQFDETLEPVSGE